LNNLDVPDRLTKHLNIVHATAYSLLRVITESFPNLVIDKRLVLFGAASHDIGKIIHPEELHEPGKMHELAGMDLLKKNGFSNEESRFAFTHGNWKEEGLTIEDLLVSLADKLWKGKRIEALEEKIRIKIDAATSMDYWNINLKLDAICEQIARDADRRLSEQL
jgi:hypothetical protein